MFYLSFFQNDSKDIVHKQAIFTQLYFSRQTICMCQFNLKNIADTKVLVQNHLKSFSKEFRSKVYNHLQYPPWRRNNKVICLIKTLTL